MNISLEGSKSSAGAESRVAVAPVEGMSAYGGSCSGSFVAAMLFALPTLVAGQPGDGGRRDQDGDFGAYLFFFVLLAGYTAMVILGVLACIWCQQFHGERRQVGGKGAGKGRAYSNREMDEWYGNDVANIHYSDEEAIPTPRLRRRRTTGSSSRGSGDGRTTSPAYSEADGPPIQDPEREPFNLWRSPDEFEEDDMPAIPKDYVPTPSTPDHWVPMSTRIQERRDRAEDARGGKGKGKEKGKEKGGREIFRPGQGARLRPATPSPSVCPAEESQEETSVASTPGTADVTPDEEEEEADPAIPFPHGAKAPPAAWMQGQRPPGQPQGPFPQQQGLQGPQAMQQGPIGPQPQHEPQGAEGVTPKAAPATEGATPKAAPAAGSTASQAVYAAAAAGDEPRGGDQAEPAGEPGLPDDGPRRGESNEVPRPTIYTAAFGTVYHVRPSCGKLRCASRIFRHEAFTPCTCEPLRRGGMIYILDNRYHTVNHSGFPMSRRACTECAGG